MTQHHFTRWYHIRLRPFLKLKLDGRENWKRRSCTYIDRNAREGENARDIYTSIKRIQDLGKLVSFGSLVDRRLVW